MCMTGYTPCLSSIHLPLILCLLTCPSSIQLGVWQVLYAPGGSEFTYSVNKKQVMFLNSGCYNNGQIPLLRLGLQQVSSRKKVADLVYDFFLLKTSSQTRRSNGIWALVVASIIGRTIGVNFS